MIIKIVCKNHIFLTKKLNEIPSPANGTGSTKLINPTMIWTGTMHLSAPSITLANSQITKVLTRSNDYKSDEEWNKVWERTKDWNYEDDHIVEKILTNL